MKPEPCRRVIRWADGGVGKGGQEGTQKTGPSTADISRTDREREQAARIFATVPALRAMSCQMNKLNGLLLQADYDNVKLYRSAIQKMQQAIEDLNARAITAAAAVRSSKACTIFQRRNNCRACC